MPKRKPIQWRGKLIDLDAMIAADPDIWPAKVATLTRCLMAYLDELGPGHQDGVIYGPMIQMQEDVERVCRLLFSGQFAEMDAICRRQQELIRERRPEKKPVPRLLRKAVFERDGFRCVKCGGQWELSADHIHPESKGGPTTLENLQALCRKCNSIKYDKVESLDDKKDAAMT